MEGAAAGVALDRSFGWRRTGSWARSWTISRDAAIFSGRREIVKTTGGNAGWGHGLQEFPPERMSSERGNRQI